MKEKALSIIEILKLHYPDALCALQYEKDYELMIAVRLSAQCTDARVNLITPALFAAYPTLEAMAALTGYSVSRFCALYSARFQKSPKAELLEIRLAMAKDRLRYSDLSVSAVAAECGFQSLYYFSKYFRQQTGLSPTAFREKHTSPGL